MSPKCISQQCNNNSTQLKSTSANVFLNKHPAALSCSGACLPSGQYEAVVSRTVQSRACIKTAKTPTCSPMQKLGFGTICAQQRGSNPLVANTLVKRSTGLNIPFLNCFVRCASSSACIVMEGHMGLFLGRHRNASPHPVCHNATIPTRLLREHCFLQPYDPACASPIVGLSFSK